MSEALSLAKKSERQLTKAEMGIREGLPLEASEAGLEGLRRGVQLLMDMEAIRQLKHAYFRCIDTANFEELSELFHDDVSVHFVGGNYEWKFEGKRDYLEAVRGAFTCEAVGHHNGHHPEIQILSETEATGIWYLADNMWVLNFNFFTSGTALYWDRYLKVDGRWTIKDTRYRRIYEINRALDERPAFAAHHLAAHGTATDAGS